jgi:hypothetical protein
MAAIRVKRKVEWVVTTVAKPYRFQVSCHGWVWMLFSLTVFAFPSQALIHSVDNFRTDFSGTSADTVRINASFGDTLFPSVILREYRTIGYRTLTNGKVFNGLSGCQSMAAVKGDGEFEFAYVSWPAAHSAFPGSVPVSDIRQRYGFIRDDSAGFADSSRIIAEAEMPFSNGNRAPSHLWYEAHDSSYIAYWSNLDNGKLRRTSDLVSRGGGSPASWGSDVPTLAPATLQAYGAMGGSAVPGSGMRKTVLGYVSDLTGASSTIEIRWEDLQANTSNKINFIRTTAPEDFSVAADSAGRTVILWRETSVLYMAAYNADHTILQPPVLITGINISDIPSTDLTNHRQHFYRPFHVISLRRNDFQIVYGRSNQVFTRHITLNTNSATVSSNEVMVSRSGQVSFFPSIATNSKQAIIAWFQRTGNAPSALHRLKSSIYSIVDGNVDTASKFDFEVANDSVGFTEVTSAWTPYHYFQTASVAMDNVGNFAVGYSDGFHAKGALVKYAAVYPESSFFQSKPFQVANASAAFNYDASLDSVEYFPFQLSTIAGVQAKLAVSNTSGFSAASDSFRTVTTSLKTAGGNYRYRIRLKTLDTAHLFPARLSSLTLPFNVKPRAPHVDSIRFSNQPWRVYSPMDTTALVKRLDSVEFRLSALDLDDADTVTFAISLGGTVIGTSTSSLKPAVGHYLWYPKFPAPDTSVDTVTYQVRVTDSRGWISSTSDIVVRLTDPLPITTVKAFRHRGLDSGGTFFPNRGPIDTLVVSEGDTLWAHQGDSLQLDAHIWDLNDSLLTMALGQSGQAASEISVTRNSTTRFSLALPTQAGLLENWTLKSADPDSALFFHFHVRTNFPPELDTLELLRYALRNGTMGAHGGMITEWNSKPSLPMPALVPATLKVWGHDPDNANEKVQFHWQFWRRPSDCELRNAECITIIDSSVHDTLNLQVQPGDDQVRIRVMDNRKAFSTAIVSLTYSLADTNSVTEFRNPLMSLDSAMDFVMLSGNAEKSIEATLRSQGSDPLRILNVKTSRNQAGHLELTLVWQDSLNKNKTQTFTKGTQQNPIENLDQVVVPSGENLTIRFRFFTTALKGDTLLVDTLVLQTNDIAAPILKIPFRLIHRELPRLSLFGNQDLEASGNPAASNYIGLKSGLRLAFSEPVHIPPNGFMTVYSLLDSLAKPKSYQPITGSLVFRRSKSKALALQASQAYQMALSRAKRAAITDSQADTLIFIPNYSRPSDSLKATPKPGQFLPRDILRVRISNAATDPMGNALDLRRERVNRTANTYDTLLTVYTDTSVLRIVESIPAWGDSNVNPDASVRLRFNRPLATDDIDELEAIDLSHLQGGENTFLEWSSSRTGGQPLDLAAITLLPGDSELVIKPRERATAFDTVTLIVSGAVLDQNGGTLDGNGDGFPGFQFNPQSGVDDWTLTYFTGAAGFYVFPNPFRFDNPRHAERGHVTFKNLNSLKGWKEDASYSVRVHDMAGDLVWNQERHSSAGQRRGLAVVDWNLKNDQGTRIATGVYVYSVTDNSNRLLIKGKLAVIR